MRLGHKLFYLCPLVAFSVFFSLKVFGGYSEEVTPVPIPNTEVKLFSADGTAWETAWESRKPPNQLKKPFVFTRGFFYSSRHVEIARCNRGKVLSVYLKVYYAQIISSLQHAKKSLYFPRFSSIHLYALHHQCEWNAAGLTSE